MYQGAATAITVGIAGILGCPGLNSALGIIKFAGKRANSVIYSSMSVEIARRLLFWRQKGQGMGTRFDLGKFIHIAKGGAKPVAARDTGRLRALRARHREVAATGNSADELAVLQEWAELTAEPAVLRRLASALVRDGERDVAVSLIRAFQSNARAELLSEKRDLLATIAWQNDHDKSHIQETARAAALANAAQVISSPEVLSRLEDMISARLGAAVRHIRGEPVLRAMQVPGRAIVYRRTYTKHWFEVSGDPGGGLPVHLGDDGTLGVFVKSGSELPTRPDLEFIVSQPRGYGFRTPYFFGQFAVSELQFAAWESLDIHARSFLKLPLGDQTRVVEAVAILNALNANGVVPVETKWINARPAWFQARYMALKAGGEEWEELYASTVEALKHQEALVADFRAAGETFLTHNDVTVDGSNIFVPDDGDIVVFDWDAGTTSVPGADLGFLCEAGSRERLLTAYVEKMGELGCRLNVDRIRFTADVLLGFRLLQAGWRTIHPNKIRRGLNLLASHINIREQRKEGTL